MGRRPERVPSLGERLPQLKELARELKRKEEQRNRNLSWQLKVQFEFTVLYPRVYQQKLSGSFGYRKETNRDVLRLRRTGNARIDQLVRQAASDLVVNQTNRPDLGQYSIREKSGKSNVDLYYEDHDDYFMNHSPHQRLEAIVEDLGKFLPELRIIMV